MVVVEVKIQSKDHLKHKIAHKEFQMDNFYKGSCITILKNAHANILNLGGVLDTCQALPRIGERQASRQ